LHDLEALPEKQEPAAYMDILLGRPRRRSDAAREQQRDGITRSELIADFDLDLSAVMIETSLNWKFWKVLRSKRSPFL
jgi:hypothetical protein